MAVPLKLIIDELEMPYGSGQRFKGRIFSGNPSRIKPRDVTLDEWYATILRLAASQWKSHICIPYSLLSNQGKHHEYSTEHDQPRYLDLMDDLGSISDDGSGSPASDIIEIIVCLTRGEDILILSQTRKISGFLPAILVRLCHPRLHILKLLREIEHSGYEITAAQRGYIAGLSDAEWLQEQSAMRGDLGSKDREVYDDDTNDVKNDNASAPFDENARLSLHAERASIQLKAIGNELLNELCYETMDLQFFFGELEKHPTLGDEALCGYLSITYRFCDAFKFLATFGGEVLAACGELKRLQHQETPAVVDFRLLLATYQQRFILIADQLESFSGGTFGFLPHDLDFLCGHPQVTQVKGMVDSVKLIRDQVQSCGDRVYEIAELARHLGKCLNIKEAPPSPKKDRDWKAMKAMLRQCIDASFGSSQYGEPE